MHLSVFFSWQSDTPAARGQDLIARALSRAALAIATDASVPFAPAIDQDTRGVPGAPSMVAAILGKIDACSILVADVSLTFERPGTSRKSPNPNVLLELGYALRRLGPERVLLVMDTDTGTPEQLPFDLRGNRAIAFDGGAESESSLEDELGSRFEEDIRLILGTVGPPHDVTPKVRLELQFSKERIETDRHDYRLHVDVVNGGTRVLKDWAVDLRFPSALLNPSRSYPIVQTPLLDGRVTMRQTELTHSGPIYPGETKEVLGIDYLMNDALYEQRAKLFPLAVEAFLYVEGDLVASNSRLVTDLQWY